MEPQLSNAPELGRKRFVSVLVVCVTLLGVAGIVAFVTAHSRRSEAPGSATPLSQGLPDSVGFPIAAGGANVPFEQQSIAVAPAVSTDFSVSEIQNIPDMQKAYGVSFSPDDLKRLESGKFVIKNLLDTGITPGSVGDNGREFVSLYQQVTGYDDYKTRTPANAVFISSDVLMNLFSILSVDLLKETENSYLYPQVLDTTKKLYAAASDRLAKANGDDERKEWTKVRDYFALPYALLSTAIQPLTADDYWSSARSASVEAMQAQYDAKDATADSEENADAFVRNLGLGAESQAAVLADLSKIYSASQNALPELFRAEYQAIPGDIHFVVPFSTFKARGSYTSSSLRRQYFRAVQWYQQIPFFTSSPALTVYAADIGALMHADQDLSARYASMSSLLGALVGDGDDLDASDYAAASGELGSGVRDAGKLKAFLDARKPASRIKSMPAFYPSVGTVSLAEVTDALRGMRFFSQKFIPDSYWTGKLSQGDEQPAVNGMKLPKSVSSLEVMTILGSSYAQSELPQLSFYTQYQQAIDTRLSELSSEANGWGASYWQGNQVTGVLWTVSGLFDWFQKNRSAAPRFMQSQLWDAKTLLTGSAFWTELRHTNILYAKQSFAEKGGGGDDVCDTRSVPPPAMGYVEPQPEAYDRLYYTARLLDGVYASRGFKLKNLPKLEEYIQLVNIAREYTKLELENTAFQEPVITKNVPVYNDPNCMENFIDPQASIERDGGRSYAWNADQKSVAAISRPEELRVELVRRMTDLLPTPVEGAVLPMKDKRTALIADIHSSEEGIVEEGTGVPRVAFVAVKDANGARLTVGFTYSQYEFLSQTRMTDEEWQKAFYADSGNDYQITYVPKSAWPAPPAWYQDLLGTR